MACVETPDVIRTRRIELDMSQDDLAKKAGVSPRQIRRYEAGEQEPPFSVAVAIADALKLPLAELAGTTSDQMDLTGEWSAAWQTWRGGDERLAVQRVRVSQRGDDIEVQTVTRGLDVEDGGYHWRGAARLHDNEVLIGWYVANEPAVRSKGSLYFVVHPHGVDMRGKWVGLSYDGKIVDGWGSMARTDEDARAAIEELKADG
jgi:transcriptional regulator with XRE-family HTH domain